MVQFINLPKSQRNMLADSLGMSIGQGLSNVINDYYINKDLQKVMGDPSLKNAPVSERLSRIESALRPHGERGATVLKNLLGVEQQRMQEAQAIKDAAAMAQENETLKAQGIDLSGIKDPGLRKAILTQSMKQKAEDDFFKQFNLDLKSAGLDQQVPIANQGMQPAPVNPQQGFQPRGIFKPEFEGNIPQAQPQALVPQPQPQPQMAAPALHQQLSPNQKAMLAFKKPQVASVLQRQSEAEQKQRNLEEKIKHQKEQELRKEKLEFHKESAKFDEELSNKFVSAKKQIEAVKDIDKAIKSGNVKPTSLVNIMKNLGPIGQSIADAMLTGDQATIQASIPQLLEGWKEVFGVRLSDADLKVLQDKLPSIGKNPEANLAITKILKKYSEMTLLRGQIGKEIKEANEGLRPLGYRDKIENRFDEMTKLVPIIDPDGRLLEIPAYKVGDAIKLGGKLANE